MKIKIFQNKHIILFLIIIGCVIPVFSNLVSKQPRLSGKVYVSSDGIDSTNCESIINGTDFFLRLIFLNDSIFIEYLATCCPTEGEYSPVEYISKGVYELGDTSLSLRYDSVSFTHYVREDIDSIKGTIISKDSIHVEFLTPDYKPLKEIIEEFKDSGIWELLFN